MTAPCAPGPTIPPSSLVLLDGAGERAFCAGGDIRELYDAAQPATSHSPRRFWADEYRLNVLIARYPKPVVALMHGVVMGGGVGLPAHAVAPRRHRAVVGRHAGSRRSVISPTSAPASSWRARRDLPEPIWH